MIGETQLARRKHFFDTVRDGLIYSCVCCKRRKFRKSVCVYDGDHLEIAQDLIEGAIGELNPRQQVRGQYFICHDCKNKLFKGKNAKMPALCHKNNLGLVDLEGKDELILTPLENALIARLLIFQYIVKLPKSQWAATKNKIVVVPIEEQDISDTLKSLPRTPDEAGIIPVQLKRKVEYKNSHREEYINVDKLYKAIDTLVQSGHPYYAGVDLLEFKDKLEFANVLENADDDESVDRERNDDNGEEVADEKEAEDMGDMFDQDEDAKYQREDVVQKHKFDYL